MFWNSLMEKVCDEEGYVVMVGDGVTDMQAKPPADVVIGYGGVVRRNVVEKMADWYITDFKQLR